MLDVGAMVLALNVSFYFCKSLPLHMNGNLPAGIGMHVFAMFCDLIHVSGGTCVCSFVKGESFFLEHHKPLNNVAGKMFLLDPS